MDYAVQTIAAQEANSTARFLTHSLTIATAFTLALATSSLSANPLLVKNHHLTPSNLVEASKIQGTFQNAHLVQSTELELFNQLSNIFDNLIGGSTELDEQTHRALYSNLWKLYE
jgi:hypothetical protein